MNIEQLKTNLQKTINSKSIYLKGLESDLLCGDYVDRNSTMATIQFLKINIDELQRILADVELVITANTEK